MTKPMEMPKPGQVVLVTRGKHAGTYAVVIKIEPDRFVWIADGDKRRFDKPKKRISDTFALCRMWTKRWRANFRKRGAFPTPCCGLRYERLFHIIESKPNEVKR